LLDVNVLIALHDVQHVHHETAAEWFAEHVPSGWASCPLTQNGVLRIMSQAAYPQAFPVGELMAMLHRSFSHTSHEFWADDISLADPGLFRAEHIHGHRQLTDIYLLALAVRYGGRFVTFDTRIALSAVRGAETQHLVHLRPA
jgi:toxin-antitoxin system PIN domain toxin